MKIYSILIIFFGLPVFLTAQNPVFAGQKGDSIILEYSSKFGILYKHNFKPKQTLYSLARFFGSSAKEVYHFNPSLKNKSIQIGEAVIIPVRANKIISDKHKLSRSNNYLPVYYRVQAKDNLFRIARHYFYQPIQSLMRRNRLQSFNLNPGDILHVGWIASSYEESTAIKQEKNDSIQLLVKNKILPEEEKETISILSETIDSSEDNTISMTASRGTAVWDKTAKDYGNLFVLHPTARINSMIELFNPMLNRRVYAEVIGKLPTQIYPKDISLVVSPKVAESLGVIDTRFLVEMRYIE